MCPPSKPTRPRSSQTRFRGRRGEEAWSLEIPSRQFPVCRESPHLGNGGTEGESTAEGSQPNPAMASVGEHLRKGDRDAR